MISPMVLWTVSAEEAKGLARSYSFSALAIWFSHCPITLSFFRTSLSPSLSRTTKNSPAERKHQGESDSAATHGEVYKGALGEGRKRERESPLLSAL